MTSNPKSNLPDQMFEDGGLTEGVQRAASALCENDDLSGAMKQQLTSELLFSAMGKDYFFTEDQAEKIIQKLMDAVLEIATATGAVDTSDEVETDEEATAADGGAADPEPFPRETTVSLSRGEPAGGQVPVLAVGLRNTTSDLVKYEDRGIPKGNRKARRARK